MKIDKDARYSKEHEWVRPEGDLYVYGISDHAQQALGDVVYVEHPEVGQTVSAGAETGVVESVKAASDIYAPVSGTITEINEALAGRGRVKARLLHDGFDGFRRYLAGCQQYACQRMCLQGHNECAFLCLPLRHSCRHGHLHTFATV